MTKTPKKIIDTFCERRKEQLTCDSCGELKSEHVDEWGRYQACIEQIINTTIASEYFLED